MKSGSILGNAVLRVEDPRILLGEAKYYDDLRLDGMVHVVFVRSPIAHARIETIDISEAVDMPGVLGVYTAENFPLSDVVGFVMLPPVFARPPLAGTVVRFVGDIVAAVVAETPAAAVDAAEMVVVDYDPLPIIVDMEAALEADAPVLFPDHGSNQAVEFAFGVDDTLMDDADIVVSGRFVNQRLAAAPMEPNGAVAAPDPETGGIHVWLPTQGPHSARGPLCAALDLPEEQVRVTAPAVGGGFGAKMGAYVEHILTAALARRLDRPVKWTETRSENMVSMVHGRAQIQYVDLGLKRDGTITAINIRVVADGGAYPATGAFLPFLTRMMAHGVYEIPKVQFNSVSAATNTTPTGAYRGAGRPEATALLERIMNMAAVELDLDPIEIRKRNFIPPEAFPYMTSTGANYDSGEYAAALDKAAELAGYADLRSEQAARRERGDNKLLGIGVSTYVEVTAGGMWSEYGSVEVQPDGNVRATVGTSSHGQGHETSFKMLISDRLGVPMDRITIIQSDTTLVPRGSGTGGSRSLQIGGSALFQASDEVVAKAKRLAAHLFEASEEDIVVEDGRIGVAGVPARALSWAELATAAADDARRPEGMEAGLAAELDFNQGDATYPFGAHIAIVEVDRETGRVQFLRHVAVDDCGIVLNPLIAAGQVHGGVAQGAAQALFEAISYDEDGNPLTTNFMDYAIPSAAELPSYETAHTETSTPRNPLGAKGIGEAGTIGSTPALQNAVIDAVAHLGITHIDMPLTAERVWRAIRDAAA
jgi:carbon-monoxide dehydrogenase large subunit